MRSFYLLSCLLVSALGVHAGQQSFLVTPYSLAGWSLVGAELPDVLGRREFSLPADAQLQRSLLEKQVALQTDSRPAIGEAAGDWPVLELGDTALVFSRSGATGRLLLVLGEQAPRELPIVFALDAEGRSVDLLAIGFARHGNAITVSAPGQVLHFTAKPTVADQSMGIVVSAGATLPWRFRRLEVTTILEDTGAAGKPAAAVSPALPPAVLRNYHASMPPPGTGFTSSSAIPPSALGAAAGAADGKSVGQAKASGRAILEIYSPSSDRHGRSRAVRAAAASAKAQN